MGSHKKRKQEKKIFAPRYDWQVGPYSGVLQADLSIPQNVLLLCKLAGIEPIRVIKDVLESLSLHKDESDKWGTARKFLIDYFIAMGYGKEFYSEEDRRLMIAQLKHLDSLFPSDAGMSLIELHAKWRNKYEKYWLKKWYYKIRRS